MPSSTLEDEIISGFSILDEDLYDAAVMDEFSLKGLVARLAALNERVRSTRAFSRGILKPHTISLIRSVSSRACILAKNMMNVHRTTDEIAAKRGNQIAEVLARMSLSDNDQSSSTAACSSVNSTRGSPSSAAGKGAAVRTMRSARSESPSASGDASDQRSPLILKTLAWLVANMHNPYPSFSRKTLFAATTGSSLSTVNNSFDTARRRIGWTKFLKKHFDGKCALALDCTHRVFVSHDTVHPVPEYIRQDLLVVKMEAEKLHAKMALKYGITGKACEAIDAVTTGSITQSKTNVCEEGLHNSDRSGSPSEIQSTPQPARRSKRRPGVLRKLPGLGNVAGPTGAREQSDSIVVDSFHVQKSRKRKAELHCDAEQNEQAFSSDQRPAKRKRLASQVSSDSLDVSTACPSITLSLSALPSVASTCEIHEALHPSEFCDCGLPPVEHADYIATQQNSRERDHSDAEIGGPPFRKRRHNASFAGSANPSVYESNSSSFSASSSSFSPTSQKRRLSEAFEEESSSTKRHCSSPNQTKRHAPGTKPSEGTDTPTPLGVPFYSTGDLLTSNFYESRENASYQQTYNPGLEPNFAHAVGLPALHGQTSICGIQSTLANQPFDLDGYFPTMPDFFNLDFLSDSGPIPPPSIASFSVSEDITFGYPDIFLDTLNRSLLGSDSVSDDGQSLTSLESEFPPDIQLESTATGFPAIHSHTLDSALPLVIVDYPLPVVNALNGDYLKKPDEQQQKLSEERCHYQDIIQIQV